MARRYGWPPGDIDESDWRLAVQATEAQQREYLDDWKRSAFVAFQLGAGEDGQKFADYLKKVGLKEASNPEPKQKRAEKSQAAIKDAMRIIAKDKKRAAK